MTGAVTDKQPAEKCEVLITFKLKQAVEEVEALSKNFNVYICPPDQTLPDLLQDLRPGGRFDSILAVIWCGFRDPSKGKLLPAEVINQFPSSLRAIVGLGTGYDHVDVEAATRRGIQVSNTPDVHEAIHIERSLAQKEYVFLLQIKVSTGILVMIQCAEMSAILFDETDNRAWYRKEQQTLGIIGLGNIGSALARRVLPLDMKVVYYSRHQVSDEELARQNLTERVTYVASLEELVKQSDAISIHIPMMETTRGLFSRELIGMMKPSAVLINTARGGVVDQDALIDALEAKKIFGAGLDVFADEPNVPQALKDNPAVSILPHAGTKSYQTEHKIQATGVSNVRSVVTTGRVRNLVPEQHGKV